MKILGIDTTTKSASCSILNEDKYYTKAITNDITHSEKLLPIIDETINEAGLSLDDISILAAINGPGSFTGIRIGLATIKAFAQVKNLDIFSISSIDLISYCAFKNTCKNESEKYILAIIDARNNRVYYGLNKVVNVNGKVTIEKVLDVGNDLIDDAMSKVKELNITSDILIAGDCVDKFEDLLSSFSCISLYPTTNDLIDCYLNLSNASDYIYNAYSLDALYARPSQAERVANNG